MKHGLFVLLVLMASLFVEAYGQSSQSVFTVKGVLVDSLTHESEPYATIRIFSSENLVDPVRLAVTDGDGKFKEKLKKAVKQCLKRHFLFGKALWQKPLKKKCLWV